MVKANDYTREFNNGEANARQRTFADEATKIRGKKELGPDDWVFAVQDLVRVSIEAPDVIQAVGILNKLNEMPGAKILCRKNTFGIRCNAAPAQYRDVKTILAVDYREGFDSAFWFFEDSGGASKPVTNA